MGKCPAALALAQHGHEHNIPRARQPWACAQRPSHSADMDMSPRVPCGRPTWACTQRPSHSPGMDMPLSVHRTRPTWNVHIGVVHV
ncbi:hypothetical protein HAX54_026182 [Datura stramonium]|uniref:Uncharacterized protein n=1 Tax=Datura stramonium TaxID=4076 RepID=A0ABS8V0W3_DATST|nr:hypothetical protein [Datura stramonium]